MGKLKVGLQLFSVRDDMAADMEGTLAKVKEMGYDYVEFAGYFGHSAGEVREMLDKYGLKCISVHQDYYDFVGEKRQDAIAFLKEIGAEYYAVPWYTKHKDTDEFNDTVAGFSQLSKDLKEAGIQMLYHNHDFEFNRTEGKFNLDWLYETIDADLLKTEVDTCWVRYAGYNPAEYIMKYAGRSPVVHLKDFECKNLQNVPMYALDEESVKLNSEEIGFNLCPVGYGVQDFPAILKAAEEAGAEYVIVEQDNSTDRPAIEAVKMSRDYLKSLGI